MGLIEIAANKSIWRGIDYCKNNKVISWDIRCEGEIDGVVSGSNSEKYDVHVDEMHPRKSKCNCPFAKDRRVVCKHMIAIYFTAYPDKLTDFLEYVEEQEKEWEREEELRWEEHIQYLYKSAKMVSKKELVEELVSAWIELEERNHYW